MKIIKVLLLLLFHSLLSPIFAQDSVSVSKNLFKIDFIEPGFTYEHGLSKRSTLFTNAGLGMGYISNDFDGNYFYVSPFVLGEYRNYYNLDKRLKKGKNISRNSGNFIGANIGYYFVPIGHEDENWVGNTSMAAFWGMQRTYKKNFNLNLEGGVLYNFAEIESKGFRPYVRLTIGIVLGKKK